jgi:CheY-like chemotaxis protein
MTNVVHILIVQDDAIDIEIMLRIFQDEGIDNPFTVAPTAQEALNILRGEGGYPRLPRPYLIVLDLGLPGLNGLEFLKMIRADPELQRSIVFVVSGSERYEDQAAAYDLHIAGYVINSVSNKLQDLATMFKHYLQIVEFPVEESGLIR